jgi:hypothetical protein
MVELRVLPWKWCYDLGPKQNWGHGVSGVAPGRFDPARVERPQQCESGDGNGALDIMNIGANEALPCEADDGDPAEQVARLESRLDELADAMARCRKIGLIAQIAIAAGGTWLLAAAIGIIGFDPMGLVAAIAGVIGGTVMYGSNTTTSRQVDAAIEKAEAMRAALIEAQDS